ncbi:ATP-dependent helicase/nuclease subunit A [Deinobacterium chartae]|uniref:DNA 3'-5' helicase n=1 Tax=Deinobacterium chartae TaxID=521158 RepID=A0A841I3R6_9DEIO|nr:ATP-dependent helicase/nuclease subunit A [Deinobacterium chartae]
MSTVMTFTEAQRAAIEAPESVAISAGAGSGKTRVLAERVLARLAGGTDPASVLAVTFTEAAAAELRERITRTVEREADLAPTRWARTLARLPLMQVSTLHALCGRIAREHPVESGASLGFSVLDEVQTRAWLEAHLSVVLAELDLQTLLDVPSTLRMDALREMLADEDAATAALEVSAQRAAEDPEIRRARAWAAHLEDWQAAHATLAAQAGPEEDPLEALRRNVLQLLGPYSPTGGIPAPAALRALARSLEIYNGRLGHGWKAEAKGRVHAALKALRVRVSNPALLEGGTQDRALLALRTVFEHVRRRCAALRAEQDVATFGDLERLADRALAHPQVRAHYHARWTTVLVDEFQDTNPVQWRILQALLGEDTNVTVVGDEKQSIYAFRRADVTLFHAARDNVAARGGRLIQMTRSFRTHHDLVGTLNRYFQSAMSGPAPDRPTHARFEPLEAARLPNPSPHDPCVELHVLLGDSTPTLRAAEARHLATRLQALHSARRTVYDRATGQVRALRWSDVAILLRVRSDMKTYEEALAQAGIPFVVHGGRGLFERPEVQDQIQLLRTLADPHADLPLAAVLRSPYLHLTDQELLDTARLRQEGDSLWDALQRNPQARMVEAARWLRALRDSAATLSAAQVLTEADRRMPLPAVHAALPDGERRVANLTRFRALLRAWAAEGTTDVTGVAAHLEELLRHGAQEAEAVSSATDAVNLMTVHGSKGLEFPVVILADALRQGGGPPPAVLFDPQLGAALRSDPKTPEWETLEAQQAEREAGEAERVLYVAFTRAADLLILSAPCRNSPQALKQLQAFSAHLPEEHVSRTYLSPALIPAPVPLGPKRDRRVTTKVGPDGGPVLPDTLPVTSVAVYLTCPREFEYSYVSGHAPLATLWQALEEAEAANPERRAAGRQVGDAVHRALEHGWSETEIRTQLAYLSLPDLDTTVRLCNSLRHPAYAALHGRTPRREIPVTIDFEGLHLEGVVDAYYEDEAQVLDYKTDRHVDPEHHLPQLALYAHRLGARSAALAYLRHDRLHIFGPEDLERGLQRVRAAAQAMQAKDFRPHPGTRCPRCPFRGICDAAPEVP